MAEGSLNPIPGDSQPLSIKDIWPKKKKMPRDLLESELVKARQLISQLQIECEDKQKITDNMEKRYSDLERELQNAKNKTRNLERKNEAIQQALATAYNINQGHVKRITTIIYNNRYSSNISGSRNIQIGDNNTLTQEDGYMDQLVDKLEELTKMLTSAVQENAKARSITEMKLKEYEVMMKESRELEETIAKSFKDLDKKSARELQHGLELIEVLTSDRSDEHVIMYGITQVKKHLEENRNTSNLPLATEVAITRLLNKFESLGSDSKLFAELIGVDVGEEQQMISEREAYKKILFHWLDMSQENTAEKLLSCITDYESKFSADMIKEFENETIGTDHSKACQMSSLTPSETSDVVNIPGESYRGQDIHGLPDRRSRFMHQIEGLNILLDIQVEVRNMSDLVNDIHRHYFDKGVLVVRETTV